MSNGNGTEPISCFSKKEVAVQVALLPSQSAHCIQAVKDKLNNTLFTFDEQLDGIPLSYSELHFPKGREYGRIFIDLSWVHVDVVTSMVVFKPVVGAQLSGKIVKMSDNHVSVLVLSMFNATLSSEEMRKFYSYDYSLKTWSSTTGELNEGDEISFQVASFQHSDGVVNIVARLLSSVV